MELLNTQKVYRYSPTVDVEIIYVPTGGVWVGVSEYGIHIYGGWVIVDGVPDGTVVSELRGLIGEGLEEAGVWVLEGWDRRSLWSCNDERWYCGEHEVWEWCQYYLAVDKASLLAFERSDYSDSGTVE